MLLWLELSSIAPSAEMPATAQYGLHTCHIDVRYSFATLSCTDTPLQQNLAQKRLRGRAAVHHSFGDSWPYLQQHCFGFAPGLCQVCRSHVKQADTRSRS